MAIGSAVTVLRQIVWMRFAQNEVAWALVALLVGVTAALGTVFGLNFTVGHLEASSESLADLGSASRWAEHSLTKSRARGSTGMLQEEADTGCRGRPDCEYVMEVNG
ncbi:hypothetical protein ACFVTP_31675 [Streptomyces celluloflavus]|uniref:hypothetical protein n=1 Tax=Streptomyces celluloflavus TaxID=58344 RepID=UPI0036DF6E22